MRKYECIIFLLIIFLSFSSNVQAARGDLNYEVEEVSLSDKNGITIRGYAFIHRTHNYVNIHRRVDSATNNVDTSVVVKSNGGQKVKIKVTDVNDENVYMEKEYIGRDDNYNFYYQMFYKDFYATSGSLYYDVSTYNNPNLNKCDTNSSSQCYYEDLGFKINFSLNELLDNFSSNTELKLYIAAYNNDYGKYTEYKELKIPNVQGKSNYIEVTRGSYRSGEVDFIGIDALLRNLDFTTLDDDVYGCNNEGINSKCSGNDVTKYNIFNYSGGIWKNGTVIGSNNNICVGDHCTTFLNGTKSPRMYAICAYTSGNDINKNACSSVDSSGYCTSCDGEVLAAYASWINLSGTNQLRIRVKDLKRCDPEPPSSGSLECNESKVFNSVCDELTVETSEGLATVRIEQTGTVSSILTPDSIYAGGGFNFGIMYYNSIKWSYVNEPSSVELRNAVEQEMNLKIKGFENYVAGLNITELKLGGKSYDSNFLVKSCKTSDDQSDYYDKELTVSCVFYFPESYFDKDGTVNYNYGVSGLGISNKYYTPIIYKDDTYKIQAKIVGMDRITSNAALNDSSEKGQAWTGYWFDTFNCQIDIYPLLYIVNGNSKTKYNFIYRPINIYNPFPSRNPGINWFDWYSLQKNVDRLESTYKDNGNLQYIANLDNHTIAGIKNYNKSHNYLEWDSINEETGDSSFITDYNYVDRIGGN